MRNLIYAINLSLDGCCDHAKIGGSEEILNYYTKLLQGIDLIIYGRKTYELMIPYWPDVLQDESSTTAEIEYAQTFNMISKIVYSKTLTSVEDKNTRLVQTNIVEEIIKLKLESGKPMLVGGVELPSELIAQGLVDELNIVIHPVIIGKGRRLFNETDLQQKLGLKLIESKIFESGAVALRYLKK